MHLFIYCQTMINRHNNVHLYENKVKINNLNLKLEFNSGCDI